MDTVNFKYTNGYVGVLTVEAAEVMESKGYGKVVSGEPEPAAKPAKKAKE